MNGLTTKRNVLILAAVLGLITGLLTYRFLRTAQAANQQALVPVVMTTQEILPRTIVEPAMVTRMHVPASEVPGRVYLRAEDVVGKVALARLPRNSPVKISDIAAKGASLGLSYVIPRSMRAVTVAVDPVSGVGGYLKPGDHVDVVATFRTFGIDREAVARTVLQDVQLLALGSQIEKERLRKDGAKPSFSSGKDTATLLVTPAEAERLALAEAEGKLRLALRSAGDIARVDSKGITSAAVIGISASGEMGPAQRVSLVEQSKPTQTPERPVVQPTPPPKQQERLPATNLSRAAQPAKEQLHEIVVIRGTDVQKVQVSR